MNTDLMCLTRRTKTGVIDQITATGFFIDQGRVVTGSHISVLIIIRVKRIISHHLDAQSGVIRIRIVHDSAPAGCIRVWTIRIFGAEESHIVATG